MFMLKKLVITLIFREEDVEVKIKPASKNGRRQA